ncbi:Regulator of nonsense transcripts 1 homolog [Durusdinium trenchii]|uniref:ATP-dependent DNA helicase n=1 Tax=Durusdinium trenchii TaxID=1381693 RepID=A0ABP0RSR4_9DINO
MVSHTGVVVSSASGLQGIDISHPEMAKLVPNDYDRIRDGAEVEVINSACKGEETSFEKTSEIMVNFAEGYIYRLDRLASTDQTRRMLDALKVILKNPANLQHLPLESVDFSGSKQTLVDRGVSSNGGLDAGERQKWMVSVVGKMEGLSAFQQEVTCEDIYENGKTTTAVQIVAAMVRYGLVDLPILVTADSNTAVDNLVKGIGKTGVNIVRVGRPEAIREDVKSYALDGRWKDLKKAEVVCATCIGASGTTLDKVRFPTVIVDECTQAAETAALVPIARGCQQAILIGDQCQLPPTVLSDVAETENLGESLFTRLVTQGVRPCLLDTQYRMHPLVAEFASAAFYNGRLQNGVSHIHRKPPEGFPWPQRHMPVAFINLEKCEEKREGHGSSYINPAEAEKTMWALLEVTKNGKIGPEDVGIVTPYKGQVRLLKKLINERPGLQKFRSGLEVESVDRFQGQEKEVIIFCAVRNNREGKVGFLCDWRRLNVMLTRARIGLIVIGSRSTLMSDPLWHEWLIWAAARGAICGESAKGNWVPRYLVDDRDGIWTVKQGIIEEVQKGIEKKNPAGGNDAPAKVEQKEEDILDSWEDMESPLMTPANESQGAGALAKALEEDPAELPEADPEAAKAVCSVRLKKTPVDSELLSRHSEIPPESREGLGSFPQNPKMPVALPKFSRTGWVSCRNASLGGALLTKAQQTVVDLVLRGHNVFLTGAAGSGKSVVLEAVNHQAKRQVALTAATGGAALLIGGETTHAWAGLGQATGSAEELVQRVRSDAAACHRWTGTTLLVIDEVSMISARLLDILDLCGRAARGTVQRPFGGLQVLLCGDFHQLPPVSRKEGWAFQAKVWAEAISISLELTEVLRTDPEEQQLALALEEVRKGQVGQSSWQFLESLASKPRPRDRCPVVVVPTNRQADQINEAALKALSAQAEVHCYSAVCMGQRTRMEVPQELCLCQGAVVVLTASIRVGPQGDVKWANGLRCCVTGFVELPRRVFDHRHPDFDPVSRSLRQFLLRHEGKLPKLQALQDTDVGEQVLYPVHFGEDTGTEDGGLVQLPLRLGWALTAHRAQGASLETGAVAMLRGLFSPGQAYVTLSRCRRAKDLWIEGLPARSSDGHVAAFAPEPEVQSFYAAMRAPSG